MIGRNFHQQMPDTKVKFDEYNSDLNLEVSKDGFSCYPMHKDGFAYMWAGVKATHGVRQGKVCFEVKIVENLEVSTSEFTDAHIVRVGWSTDAATLQLGEDKNSFGYGGTAKKSEGRKFSDYGRRFDTGDVVGCYLSIASGWADISYCVNGYQCGTAFKVRWDTDEALFPHILTKNCKVEVNFGQAHNPYFSLQPGFKLIGSLPVEQRVRAVTSPATKQDCEVIMMVGLPGVGKTTWAMNYAKLHPNKKYNILGTDAIIDKMRVQGLPRKDNFGGRWDVLIKQASECFNIMLRKASTCKRNLILDQTNVYTSARKRKVRQYKDAGYTVNAMVLVPTDGDMISRSKQRTIKEGKEVPEAAVYDMKANFSLPHEDEKLFSSITFLELQRDDAENLVVQYNIDAALKGYKSKKQSGHGPNENQKEIIERRQSGTKAPNAFPSYDRSATKRSAGLSERTDRVESKQPDRQSQDGSYEREKRQKLDENRSRDAGRSSRSRDERTRDSATYSGKQDRRGRRNDDVSYSRRDSSRSSDGRDRDSRQRRESPSRDQRYDRKNLHGDRGDSHDRDKYGSSHDTERTRSDYVKEGTGSRELAMTRSGDPERRDHQWNESHSSHDLHAIQRDGPPVKSQRQSSPQHWPVSQRDQFGYQENIRDPEFFRPTAGIRDENKAFTYDQHAGAPNPTNFTEAIGNGASWETPTDNMDIPRNSRRKQQDAWPGSRGYSYPLEQNMGAVDWPSSNFASAHDAQEIPKDRSNRGGYQQEWSVNAPSHFDQTESFPAEVEGRRSPHRRDLKLADRWPEKEMNERGFGQGPFHQDNLPHDQLGHSHQRKYPNSESWSSRTGKDIHFHQEKESQRYPSEYQDVKAEQGQSYMQQEKGFPDRRSEQRDWKPPYNDRSVYEALTPKLSDLDFENLKATLANVRQAHQDELKPSPAAAGNKESLRDPYTVGNRGVKGHPAPRIDPEQALASRRSAERLVIDHGAHQGSRDVPVQKNVRNEPIPPHPCEKSKSHDAPPEKRRLSPSRRTDDKKREENRSTRYRQRSRSPVRRSQRDRERSLHRDSQRQSPKPSRRKETSYHEVDEQKAATEMERPPRQGRKPLLETPILPTKIEHSEPHLGRRHGREGRHPREITRHDLEEYPVATDQLPFGSDNWDQRQAVEHMMQDNLRPDYQGDPLRNPYPERIMPGPMDIERPMQSHEFQEIGRPHNDHRHEDFPPRLRQPSHRPPLLETPEFPADHSRPPVRPKVTSDPRFDPLRFRGSAPRTRAEGILPRPPVRSNDQNARLRLHPGGERLPRFPRAQRPLMQTPRGPVREPFPNQGIRPNDRQPLLRGQIMRPPRQDGGYRGPRPRPWDPPRQMRPRVMRPFIRR